MIRTFATRSSLYEQDIDGRRIRRIWSSHAPTPRQGTDGDWLAYMYLEPPVPTEGLPLTIIWSCVVVDARPVLRTTVTSEVMSVGDPVVLDVSGEATAKAPAAQGGEAGTTLCRRPRAA